MHKLILQLQEHDADSSAYIFRWWLFHQQNLVQSGELDSHQSLIDAVTECLPDESMRGELICIPPSYRVHYRYLEVPKQQLKHLRQLTPFLMESHVGQPVEEMHFVANKDKHLVQVAAVSKAVLQHWQSLLDPLKFASTVILPTQYFVTPDTQASIDFYGDVMKLSDQQVCYVPDVLQRADVINDKITIEDVSLRLSQSTQWRSLNLLQGAFAPPSTLGKYISGGGVVLGLVLAALSVHVMSLHWQAKQINAQSERIEQQTANAFLELVPDEGRVVNLSRQLQARLRQSPPPDLSDDMTPYGFLAELDRVKSLLGLAQGLQQVTYRDDTYRFEWRVPQRSQLDQLAKQLSDAGITTQLEQVVREDQGFKGVFSAMGGQ